MIGEIVSHYRITEKLGEGGMGVVYLAEDKHLKRRVAIKFLSSTDHHYRARFIREARAVSALSHPNIATVHDYGETELGTPFIVMEYVKGKTLSEILDEGLTMRRAVEIITAIAEALSEAHEHGIVHRDIKPSNIVVNERGQVKVLDFGLVKNMFDQSSSGVDLDADTLYSTQTRSDVIVGTPLYLSPEQATGKAIDGRSDLFALGALLYEALTGQSAFSGSSVLEIGAQIIHVNPEPPSSINKRIPPELDIITMKALEKKVEARYQSAQEMISDLKKVMGRLSGESVTIAARASRPGTNGDRGSTSVLQTLTTSLRRERFSLTSIMAAVLLTGLAIWGAYHFWPRRYYQPSAAALSWYDRGSDAMRNGAYYQASKMLDQAIAIDGNYALARARLAQAWTELDYTDRAKDELLAATAHRTEMSPKDVLYLDAITATVRRDFASAVKSYTAIAQESPEDPQGYVDLGYAYENDGNTDKAIENYEKAISLNNGQYATAYLRAGAVYRRKQNAEKAKSLFDTAEKLFSAASNNEGLNEVLHLRGILYRERGRYDDARAQFQRALDSARTLGNEAQQITELIELSYLASTNGDSAESENFAHQAVTFAQQNHLELLAAGGLLELGNSYSSRGDYPKAEEYFKQAISFAQANKGRVREARGFLNLGGLYIQTLRVDDGLKLVQQAMDYFEANNYPGNVSLCLTQIGRGYRRKGNYPLALEALNKKLELAKQGGNQVSVADCYAEIGAVLIDQQDYPAALTHYDNSLKIYQSVNNKLRLVFNKVNLGNILWRLGRYDEAHAILAEASATMDESKGDFKQLFPVLPMIESEIFLSQRRLSDAQARSSEAVTMAGKDYTDVAIEAKFVLGLAKALSGDGKGGQTICEEAVNLASSLGDVNLQAQAMLAQAEAALKANFPEAARTLAIQAQQRFATGSQLESEWRAWLTAAQASQQLGDKPKADEQLNQARSARARLEQQWGAEAFKTYISRPDIQVYSKELG
jgi:tetratricopeptide (TPR) repeat protein/tRNA A-37 threonylcarbamoyl transferase component Bud32